MLFLHAILKSGHGIARRRRTVFVGTKRTRRFEYQIAMATIPGEVFIFSGKAGNIRRIEAVDMLQTDWEPFYEFKRVYKSVKKEKEEFRRKITYAVKKHGGVLRVKRRRRLGRPIKGEGLIVKGGTLRELIQLAKKENEFGLGLELDQLTASESKPLPIEPQEEETQE